MAADAPGIHRALANWERERYNGGITLPTVPMVESVTITPYDRDTPLKPMVDVGVDALAAEITQGKSDGVESFLRFAARFPRRSVSNQFLIYNQAPGALAVRSHDEWAELGYPVAKGAKGIRILQSKTWTKEQEGGESESITAVVSTAVFDVSQLAPEAVAARPLPDEVFGIPAYSLAELSTRLDAAIAGDGLTVVEAEDASKVRERGALAIRPGLTGAQRFGAILFAYAHYLARFDRDGGVVAPEVQRANAASAFFTTVTRYGLKARFPAGDVLPGLSAQTPQLLSQLDTIRGITSKLVRRIEDGPVSRSAHNSRA